ncbi:MAG TPA: HD domain-containing phosphohydrolase [Candidatus Limnocylindria bacterium]|jgi:putative two-component system response regulator
MAQLDLNPLPGSPSIVVAEDDAATRALLRVVLERAGYEVRQTDNGADALAEILRQPPVVALLDIGMPEMDGLEVTRRLRSEPLTALLPIIMVTARGRLEDKVAGLDAGASDFITKPFEPAELLARVRSNQRLATALTKLENTRDVLVALASAIDAKDPVTEHHCGRVAELATSLAGVAGLSEEAIEAVAYGAVLHDVGKIGIAEAVLRKAGELTDVERTEMQRHPVIGAEILSPLRLGVLIGPIVRGHHEWWDGTGYPDHLSGEAIPVGARIVSVVDAYDAMTHARPYRAALSLDEARAELVRCRGIQFDPEVVDLLLGHLDSVVEPLQAVSESTPALHVLHGEAERWT